MSLIDDILGAISVLSSNLPNVNSQDLLPRHRQELQSAFYSLERILSSGPLCLTSRSESTSSTASPLQQLESARSGRESCLSTSEIWGHSDDTEGQNEQNSTSAERIMPPSKQDRPERPLAQPSRQDDGVSSFMERLKRSSKKIRLFVAKAEEDAICRSTNWTELDPRLVDIDFAERHTSETGKFRGWLGRYSLAEDYLAWAEKTYHHPREAYLILDEKSADQRGQGHITEFLSVVGLPKGKSHKAIRHGLKYISFEHIYGNHGVSVFLCHMFTAFRDLPYSQLKSLATAIHESAEWSNLATEKADWLSRCRLIYNEDIMQYRYRSLSRKRPLELEQTNQQSQHKRVETANSAAADGDPFLNNASASLQPPPDFGPAQATSDLYGEQRLSDGILLRPNFDVWEDLNMFQSLDLWQEDFGPVQDPMFQFCQTTAGTEGVGNITSEQRNTQLEAFNAYPEDDRQNAPQVRATVNFPLFNTPAVQPVC